MIQAEYDPFVVYVYNKIVEIQSSDRKREIALGDSGETLVEYGLKWFFWNKDFRLGKFRNQTFNLIRHYKADKETGTGGIDFYLKFRTHWKTYRCFIEVKNWDDFVTGKGIVSNDRFKNQILNRFTDYDKHKLRHWILVIPEGYIRNIKTRCDCDKNKISIIPLNMQIMPELMSDSSINSDLKCFVKDFSEFINAIIKGGLSAQPKKDTTKTKTDRIWEDIRKGMPSDLVAKIHDTSVEYVYKVKSKRK